MSGGAESEEIEAVNSQQLSVTNLQTGLQSPTNNVSRSATDTAVLRAEKPHSCSAIEDDQGKSAAKAHQDAMSKQTVNTKTTEFQNNNDNFITAESMEQGSEGLHPFSSCGGLVGGVVDPLSVVGGNGVLGSPNSAFQPIRQNVHQNTQVLLHDQIMQGTYVNNLFYDSTVCCIAFYLLDRRTKDEVKETLSQTFRSDELSSAVKDLRSMRNLPPLKQRVSSIRRSAAVQSAEDLLETMEELDNKGIQPQYLLKCEDLKRCIDIEKKNENNRDARVQGIEDCMTKMMERMEAMTRTMASMQQQLFNSSNRNQGGGKQNPQRRQVNGQETNRTQNHNSIEVELGIQPATGETPTPVSNAVPTINNPMVTTQRTFASIATVHTNPREEGNHVLHGNNQMGQQDEVRERTGSFKRSRNNSGGDWSEVNRRRRKGRSGRETPPILLGTGDLSDSDEDLAGPISYWIGGTKPEVTEEKVEEVLTKIAQKKNIEDFSITQVRNLNKPFDENGDEIKYMTKSWKVIVPYKFKNTMESTNIIPKGWKFRIWDYLPRGGIKGRGGRRGGGGEGIGGGGAGGGGGGRGGAGRGWGARGNLSSVGWQNGRADMRLNP